MLLKGVGPQLNFIRSYSNESKAGRENSVLGPGWNHNHNIYLEIVAYGDEDGFYGNNLPSWVEDVRSNTNQPQIIPLSDFPEVAALPRLIDKIGHPSIRLTFSPALII